MALKKTLTIGSLFAIFASGGFAGIADAQQSRLAVPTATFDHRAIEAPGETGPLATPGVFHYDAQAFAPFEFTNDLQKKPNTGFFFSVDKVFTSVSLPGQGASGIPISDLNDTVVVGGEFEVLTETNADGDEVTVFDENGLPILISTGGGFLVNSGLPEGDLTNVTPSIGNSWTWGERYNFGWMGKDDRGWQGSFQDITGSISFRERTADLDLDGRDDAFDTFNGLEHDVATVYRVGELNRVFRQALKNGDFFEPYIGGRYTQIGDDSDDRFQTAITPADLDGDGNIDDPGEDLVVESQFRQIVTNSAIGFQIGGRHVRRRGRFTFSTDGSVAVNHNRQRLSVENFNVVDRGAFADADDDDDVITASALVASTDEYFAGDSFVPSIDLEFAISYNVTRDVTVRAGTNLNYLWQNVARANLLQNELNPNFNGFDYFNEADLYLITPALFNAGTFFENGSDGLFEDNFIAAGFTFGLEWRR